MGQIEQESNQAESQNPEPEDGESTVEPTSGEQVLSAEQQIAILSNQIEKAKDEYLRLAAEFDNYKKRTSRDFSNLVKTANEGLIVELLDVLDNFERAFSSRNENLDVDTYHKGIEMLHGKLLDTLSKEGLQRFESVGHKFDPRFHEAVMQVDNSEAEPDTIAIEIQPGYTLNDKVIRHARVGVVRSRDDG